MIRLSMFDKHLCIKAGAVFGLQLIASVGFCQLRDYQPVTAERLGNPEDGNWLSIRRTYDGWGYSPLEQITADNVKNLRPVWIFSTR